MQWMMLPLRRYFEISGRSRRREYWMFVLFTVIASVVLGIIDELAGLKFGDADSDFGDNGVLGGIFSLATLVPSITVAVRRLHDTNRRGWWLALPIAVLLAAFAALVGLGVATGQTDGMGFTAGVGLLLIFTLGSFVVPFIFLCIDGTRGPNRFGEDPKREIYEGVFD